jgi:hypothetical protein
MFSHSPQRTLRALAFRSIYTFTVESMESAFNAIANSRCARLESDMMPSSLADLSTMDFDLVHEVRPSRRSESICRRAKHD